MRERAHAQHAHQVDGHARWRRRPAFREQRRKLLLEIAREDRLAFANQLATHPAVRVPQVVQQMGQLPLDALRCQVCVRHAVFVHAFEDVVEHLAAYLGEQIVLRLKMRVKRAATHIGALDDLRHGHSAVMLPSHQFLESAVFDKTSTITEGKPQVSAVIPCGANAPGRTRLYTLLASAELRSEHPLGRAVVRCARAEGADLREPSTFEMKPGRGVIAKIDGERVAVGNAALMSDLGIPVAEWECESLASHCAAGDTLAYIAVDGKAAGAVALSGTIRRESRRTVNQMRRTGVRSVLLTGDNEAAVRTVADAAGIQEFTGSCKPEDKMRYIERTEREGAPCAMIGDGINDAPALKRAFVGIAVGGVGSDVAVEAADLVIANGGISEVPHLFALSRQMMRRIKANLTFSMALNFVAIILAFLAVLDPVSGALVHNCGSVFVIVNSAFLLRWSAKHTA